MGKLKVYDKDTKQWVAIPTVKGDPGFSAYEVAVQNGFSGTQAQWLASLKPSVLQTTGTSTTETMSQKAITDAITTLASKVVDAKELMRFDMTLPSSRVITFTDGYVPNNQISRIDYSHYLNHFVALDYNGNYWSKWLEVEGDYEAWDKYQYYYAHNSIYIPHGFRFFSMGDTIYMYDAELEVFQSTASATPIYQNTGTSTTGTMSQKAVTDKFNVIDQQTARNKQIITSLADYNNVYNAEAWGPHGIEPSDPTTLVRIYRRTTLLGELNDGGECYLDVSYASADGHMLEGNYTTKSGDIVPINTRVIPDEITENGKTIFILRMYEENRAEVLRDLNHCRTNPGIVTYTQYYDCRMSGKYGTYTVEGDCKLYAADGTLLGALEDGGASGITIQAAASGGTRVTGRYLNGTDWLPVDAICTVSADVNDALKLTLQSDFGNPPMDIKELESKMGTVKKVKVNGQEKLPDANGMVDLGNVGNGDGTGTGGGSVDVINDWANASTTNAPSSAMVKDNLDQLGRELGQIVINGFQLNGDAVNKALLYTTTAIMSDNYFQVDWTIAGDDYLSENYITIFQFRNKITQWLKFLDSTNFIFVPEIYNTKIITSFYGCFQWMPRLTTIKKLDVSGVTRAEELINFAFNSLNLETLELFNLKTDINLSSNSKMSSYSIDYIITNASNIANITIQVAPTTYNSLTEEIFSKALDKNITITTA